MTAQVSTLREEIRKLRERTALINSEMDKLDEELHLILAEVKGDPEKRKLLQRWHGWLLRHDSLMAENLRLGEQAKMVELLCNQPKGGKVN